MGKVIDVTNTAMIKEWVRKKQELEVQLAWELMEVFNDPEMGLIQELRKMVKKSIVVMDQISKGECAFVEDRVERKAALALAPERRKKFHNLWRTNWSKFYFRFGSDKYETSRGTLRRETPPGIKPQWLRESVEEGVDHFLAQHCADWIRVYGEVVEEVLGKGSVADNARLAFQKGGKFHWNKFKGYEDGAQENAGRRRVKVTDKFADQQIVMPDYAEELAHKSSEQMLDRHAHPDSLSTATVWGFQSSIHNAAGLKKWRVMEKDTTGKMDQVFGLMPGATISGTTTDNVYFFKEFGGLGLNPIFYLLPTATIVGGGHHSLVEVGIPLMLNDINNYKVGLYSTLFPTQQIPKGAPKGVEEIKIILREAEEHTNNHLMLIYYSGTNPVGCFYYEIPHARHLWNKMITGIGFMNAFQKLPPWPKKEDIKELMHDLTILEPVLA